MSDKSWTNLSDVRFVLKKKETYVLIALGALAGLLLGLAF